jgi:hypothetical protein
MFYVQAIKEGENVLLGVDFYLHRLWLQRSEPMLQSTPLSSNMGDIQQRGSYARALIPKKVQVLLRAQPELLISLPEAIQVYERENSIQIGEVHF